MDVPAHLRDRKSRPARRRDRLRGSISALAVCLPLLVGSCSAVERTMDLVTDMGNGSVEEGRADSPKQQAQPSRPLAYSQALVSAADPAPDQRTEGQSPHSLPSEGQAPGRSARHQVVWNLNYLPSSEAKPRTTPAMAGTFESGGSLESRIAPAAGGATAPARPLSNNRGNTRAANDQPQAGGVEQRAVPVADHKEAKAAPRGTGKLATILFDPAEKEISERDKVQLSLLVWPHLQDEDVTVKVRSYLPPPTPGIGPAPVLQVHRGMNVRLYLTHLGLPNERVDLTLVGSEEPDAPSHRVEVEVIAPPAPETSPEPATGWNKERAAQADLERAAGLEAFHKALRAFASQSPFAKRGGSEDPVEVAPKTPGAPVGETARTPDPDATAVPGDRSRSAASPPTPPALGPTKPQEPSLIEAIAVEHPGARRPGKLVAVQLASLPDRAAAEAEWDRVTAVYPDLLAAQQLDLQEVELDGRGRYHRVRTGPLGSFREAAALCEQLKARGQDCFTVTSERAEVSALGKQLAKQKL